MEGEDRVGRDEQGKGQRYEGLGGKDLRPRNRGRRWKRNNKHEKEGEGWMKSRSRNKAEEGQRE